jgi:hypothetical protein
MEIFFISVAIIAVLLLVYFLYDVINKDFIEKNSVGFKNLDEINKRYSFIKNQGH